MRLQYTPLSAAALHEKLSTTTCNLTTTRNLTIPLRPYNFFIEAQPEWFVEDSELSQYPIKIFDWMENVLATYRALINETVCFDSTFVITDETQRRPVFLVCHLEATIYGRKKKTDFDRYSVMVRTASRLIKITPSKIIVKDSQDRIILDTYELSLMLDGSKNWIRTFHRKSVDLPKNAYTCPVQMGDARRRLHSMIGYFTGYEGVENFFKKWFSDISAVQENTSNPASIEQARMIQDTINFFSTPSTEEEIVAFVESIKAREILDGVSKPIPSKVNKPNTSNA